MAAIAGKDINRQIAAEISWSRTIDRSARTRPAREAFLRRFEQEVDPDGTLPLDERHRRAEHAKRAYMLRLAKRAVAALVGPSEFRRLPLNSPQRPRPFRQYQQPRGCTTSPEHAADLARRIIDAAPTGVTQHSGNMEIYGDC